MAILNTHKVRVQFNQRIPMRDGITLSGAVRARAPGCGTAAGSDSALRGSSRARGEWRAQLMTVGGAAAVGITFVRSRTGA